MTDESDITQEMPEVLIPNESLVFIPLGGATGIGMNFFVYGYKKITKFCPAS